ncbi:hypothetical protein [Tardiphaga sp. 709]|uniref:hypothetical protein n=1 Tax=Tardiphaga sp. 709 TaxID=3076039 RepID=UPI0028EDE699|nr:hypothetical protein [Tardiphaga sp. 709]WNV10550.1 hypothetical protein RSO67_05010 [Tardiphaga sp. 709]
MTAFEPKPGVPKGLRFDQLYGRRGEPARDSEKMRHRIAALLREVPEGVEKFAEAELGLRSPYSTSSSWTTILQKWDVQDVMGLITVVAVYLRGSNPNKATAWISLANRLLEEENVGYRVDDRGGVHPHIDAEFASARAATISALSTTRHANVAKEFEAGTDAIGTDNKIAIVRTFMAAEGLFRLIINSSPRLITGEVDKLLPLMKARFKEDAIAERVSVKILASFKDWIDACHFYRHEQAQEAVAQPSIELAVLLVSQGASFIRLLAELDALA